MNLSIGQIKEATCSTTENAKIFHPYLLEIMENFEIDTPIRQICFLSQVGHESGGLFYTEEIASGAAYEGRLDLGNTTTGDGKKYKGRGLIQITGKFNYRQLSIDSGKDFLNNPVLLGGKNIKLCSIEQLYNSAYCAGWFWNKMQLNILADKATIEKSINSQPNKGIYIQITKKINGGINGLQDRFNRYSKGLPFF